MKILSRGEKKYNLDSRWTSIDKTVESVHYGTHNTFKNISMTDLKDKFALDKFASEYDTDNRT